MFGNRLHGGHPDWHTALNVFVGVSPLLHLISLKVYFGPRICTNLEHLFLCWPGLMGYRMR